MDALPLSIGSLPMSDSYNLTFSASERCVWNCLYERCDVLRRRGQTYQQGLRAVAKKHIHKRKMALSEQLQLSFSNVLHVGVWCGACIAPLLSRGPVDSNFLRKKIQTKTHRFVSRASFN